jgi:uncharacterized membrane protein YfhO
MTDTFYPGWQATIDAKTEAIIVPANYIFRAVYVPRGSHKIVLEYWPKHFTLAIVVAVIALLGCCALAIYPAKERGYLIDS